jgi:hypothetical protein
MLTVILMPLILSAFRPQTVLQRTYSTWDTRRGEERMSSSGRPPRTRYRFGFRGKRARNSQTATTDEILDSLTRQAKSMQKDGEERTVGLQTILESERTQELAQAPRFEPSSKFELSKTRNLGRSIFAAMLVGGLAFLWIYSRLSQTLNMQSFATLQQTISSAGFANWQKVALIALSAFTIAVLTRRSRGKARSRLFSTP